jgi:murein DD-endopeptidase MepM/ murein hydrolase activator NlpD
LLNASVGVERVLGRLRRPRNLGWDRSETFQTRSLAAARRASGLVRSAASTARLAPTHERRRVTSVVRRERVGLVARLGQDRVVAIAVASIVLLASVASVSAGTTRGGAAIGGTDGSGNGPRLEIGGGAGLAAAGAFGQLDEDGDQPVVGDVEGAGSSPDPSGDTVDATVSGPFLDDGTLLKPVAVDTTVDDGADLLRTYKVKGGDTLSGIAKRFHVSMMTLWWANRLTSKDKLHQGEVLTIPPVSGLVLTVTANDTLASIAAKYKIDEKDILDTNGLDDPNLVVGQVLVVPGAKGAPIPTPKPTKRPVVSHPSSGGGGSGGGPGVGSHYSGGPMLWPVVGGGNYISQYFHYGHYALDIAADYGSKVRAAASGTVIFAGWKDNGGGYQVWISHGSNLYTTYNHMSAITVGNGEHVGRGDQVGRIGMTGNATGPHLHFEVWRGPVWNGGVRVNPLGYF